MVSVPSSAAFHSVRGVLHSTSGIGLPLCNGLAISAFPIGSAFGICVLPRVATPTMIRVKTILRVRLGHSQSAFSKYMVDLVFG